MTDQNLNDSTIAFVPLAPGREVGPYRLVRELGVGGMGQVFLAEDTRLERQVALKFLTPQRSQEEDFRKRFMREAKSAAKLNHNNIVTVYEVGEAVERVFIAMEYVDGRSLRELIDTRALTYDQKLAVLAQLLTGMKKAHESGIVHRDLKPANIMVTSDHQVKILDFGLAKGMLDGHLTNTGTALGTVNYMSPEQAQGLGADHRSDIFSLGILLFEVLSGVNPFVRGHMPATIHAIVYEPVGHLSAYDAGLAPAWQTIIDKALGKNPNNRYQSVDDLLADIERLKAGEAITPAAVAQPSVARSETPGLAVLFLQNLGKDEDDYLCYGITEDLIIDLSKVGSMRVVPTHKVLRYKDSELDPEEIARKLNVPLVMYGSLHRSGANIRVSAQLVDVAKDDIVWSSRWEESADSLPKIKTALAQGISKALEVDSSVVRKADALRAETSNAEAYDLYLKGKYALERRQKKADVEQAAEYFRQSLELEPTMLAARVGLAEIHVVRMELAKALELLAPALEDARKRGLHADEARVLTMMGVANNRNNELETARAQLQAAVAIYRELGDIGGQAQALVQLMKPTLNMGQFDECQRLYARLGELASAGVDGRWLAEGAHIIGWSFGTRGDMARRKACHEEALQIARAQDVQSLTAAILLDTAEMHAETGSTGLATAISYLEEARFIADRLDEELLSRKVLASSMVLDFKTGSFRKIKDQVTAFRQVSGDSAGNVELASVFFFGVIAAYIMGDREQTLRLRSEIAGLLDGFTGFWRERIEADLQYTAALVAALGPDTGKAIETAVAARDAYAKLGYTDGLSDMSTLAAELLYHTGKRNEAREWFTEGNRLAEQGGDLYARTSTSGYLALLRLESGQAHPDNSSELATLRQNADQVIGHYAEAMARRLFGTALLMHGRTEEDKTLGRRQLLQALGIARRHENAIEMKRIQEVLDRHN